MATVVLKKTGFMMRWTYNDPETGKRTKRSEMFRGDGGLRAARAEANRREAADRSSRLAARGRRTSLSEFVMSQWLPFKKGHVAASTYRSLEERGKIVSTYLKNVVLSDLTARDIDLMTQRMGQDGVSPMMQRHYFDTLRGALRQAKKWRLIPDNPWEDATRPKVPKKRVKVASFEESQSLANAFREADRPIAATYVEFIADTGARPGEALALYWDQVALETGEIQIWRALERVSAGKYRLKDSPKNNHSIRSVVVSDATLRSLRNLKAWHAERHLKSGGVWPADELVFPSTAGTIWGVHAAAQVIKRKADEIGVASGSYSRRHGMASEMLAGNVPVNVIAERMGHSSTKMTLDVYGHSLPNQEDAAVRFLNRRAAEEGQR